MKTNKSALKETGERDKYKERGDDQLSLLLIFVPLTIFQIFSISVFLPFSGRLATRSFRSSVKCENVITVFLVKVSSGTKLS